MAGIMAHSRQLRINDSTIIRKRINEFTGKSVTLVLNDGRTSTGTLNGITPDQLTILNGRKKAMIYRFADVAELYFDTLD